MSLPASTECPCGALGDEGYSSTTVVSPVCPLWTPPHLLRKSVKKIEILSRMKTVVSLLFLNIAVVSIENSLR